MTGGCHAATALGCIDGMTGVGPAILSARARSLTARGSALLRQAHAQPPFACVELNKACTRDDGEGGRAAEACGTAPSRLAQPLRALSGHRAGASAAPLRVPCPLSSAAGASAQQLESESQFGVDFWLRVEIFRSMEMWDHVSMRLSVWSRGQADIIEQPYREGLLHNPVKGNFSRRDDVQRIKPVVRVMLREFETSVGGVRAAAPQQGHHSFSMRKLPKQSPALREFLGDVRGSLDADSPNARRSRGGCTSPSLRSARRASQSLVIVKEEPSLEVELESERERRSYT